MSDSTARAAVSVNGVITSPEAARVPAMDHGFLYGDSVYEVIRSFEGRPVAMDEHLSRLRASAAQIYMRIPWSDDEVRAHARAAVAATELPDQYVRIVVTRGPGPMSLLPDGCDRPTLAVYVLPLVVPDAAAREQGIRVSVPARIRNDTRALAPSAKTGNYLNNLLALVEAKRAGGADAVMVGADGHVTEATTANVFWVKGGLVSTPSLASGILSGITRSLLLPAMRAAGHDVREGQFPLADLLGADEVFLTGTVRGVMPVVAIDEHRVGDGRPGRLTREFVELHDRVLAEAAPSPW